MAKNNAWSIALYKKILVGTSVATVAITFLLGITKWLIPLLAAVLALLPGLKWKNSSVRVFVRVYEVIIAALAPALLLLLFFLTLGRPEYPFQAEYLVVTPGILQIVLPSAALLAIRDEKFDVWFMRVLGVGYAVCGFLFVFFVPPATNSTVGWLDTLLIAATSLVMLVIPFLVHPLDLSCFKKKVKNEK